MKLSASLKTFGKYIFWTAVAAGITAAINTLPKVEAPEWVIPILGAALKAAATWVSMQIKEV